MDWGAIIETIVRGLIGERFIYFALAAIGLNLHFGYTGLLNFGQAAFMAAGAYGLALTVTSVGPLINDDEGIFQLNISDGWLFVIGVFVGSCILPVLLALLMGIPTLRLRADYLAIVTIAIAEAIRIFMRSPRFDWFTGASDGLGGFSGTFYDLSPFDPGERYFFNLFIGNQMFLVIIGWIVLAIGATFCWLLIRSPWGRVLKAIREDEDAARSLGKNPLVFRLQAFALGGAIMALAGAVSAHFIGFIAPQNYLAILTFQVWAMLIVGGSGSNTGAVLGAILVWAIWAASGAAVEAVFPPGAQARAASLQIVLIGVSLCAVILLRPRGLVGTGGARLRAKRQG